ncbi:MAG: glycosyltransferase [Oscillatoriaceae bacterium SKYG93]|nr:glycosyltransferase [Oscillatoriaceae bacterium SKYG93]MDW8452697.1 glycosyltransferase [Oscillatoriaceae cyanobacterium SKYGB_i_bin93]
MKILLISRYDNLGATSRYRFYQYLPYLHNQGFNITVSPLLDNTYIQCLYSGQQANIFKILRAYAQRIFLLLQSNYYDLIWLEKEAFPWLPQELESILISSKIPYIVDYDDAWFHRYDLHPSRLVRRFLGKKIDALMRRAALVIVGNDYLAERARLAGARWVEILPTVIDLEKYPISSPPENEVFTIGWLSTYFSLLKGNTISASRNLQRQYSADSCNRGGRTRIGRCATRNSAVVRGY